MPRKRTIDEEPDRFCGHCGNIISKQKPGGKWKTPKQYRQQRGCCVECSRILRTKTKKANSECKITGTITVVLEPIDVFLQSKKT